MSIPFPAPPPQQGWACPKCGGAHAPWVPSCPVTTKVWTAGDTNIVPSDFCGCTERDSGGNIVHRIGCPRLP